MRTATGPLAATLSSLFLAACVNVSVDDTESAIATYQPPPGANEVLSGPIEAAPGHSLIVGDLVMPAGGTIPRHSHLGEEFIYVIGGSGIVQREGMPDITLLPGQGLRIPPGLIHGGRAGPEGLRGISSWVATDGQPLRIPAE